MAPRRSSRASHSEIHCDSPIQIQFHREEGRTYRPYVDPKRIAKNDAKKAAATDQRANVKGVPQEHLSVFSVTEKVASSSDGNKSDTVNLIDPASSVGAGQNLVETKPSIESASTNVEQIQNNNNDIQALFHRTLHLDIPPMTQGYQDYLPACEIPGSPDHFANGISPASSHQYSEDLNFVGGLSLHRYAMQDERAEDNLQFPKLTLINAGLQLKSQTPTSSDCSSSLLSPETRVTWDSFGSPADCNMSFPLLTGIQQGEHAYDCQDTYQSSDLHFVMSTFPDDPSSKNSNNEFMTGPDDSRKEAPITSFSSAYIDPSDPALLNDIKEITDGMHFEDEDFEYLDTNHDNAFGDRHNGFAQPAEVDHLFTLHDCGADMTVESFQMSTLL